MFKLTVPFLIICLVNSINCNLEKCRDTKGYYWRDYYGEIPEDALQGGTQITGKPIYVGQAYGKCLIPAQIFPNDNKAYYEHYGTEHVASHYIKILCTQYPEKFEWIATSNDKINLITDKTLVIGGYEPSFTTYIGRIRTGGEVLVGKVLADSTFPSVHGLHVTRNGNKMHFKSFEVLVMTDDSIVDQAEIA